MALTRRRHPRGRGSSKFLSAAELHPACSAITYVVSHRHTILRNGAGSFEDFMRHNAGEGAAARALKWQWIQQGLAAPGAADKIRLYVDYIRARPAFGPAFVEWMPDELAVEMRSNGAKSWPDIARLLEL